MDAAGGEARERPPGGPLPEDRAGDDPPLGDEDRARIARILSAATAAARQAEAEEQAEILAEVDRLANEKSGWVFNLVLLGVSVALFFTVGRFAWGWEVVLLVLAVVLVHELGHFVGMKAFGYRDVSMFFIPLFGGAVSGRGANVAGWKRAAVAMMGPMPGLLVGLACAVASSRVEGKWLPRLAQALLLINGFNMLPFYPLDGGHLLNEVLFCRSRYLELAVRVGSGVLLGLMGLLPLIAGAGKPLWVLVGLGAYVALFSGGSFRLAGVAERLRAEVRSGELEPSAAMPADVAPRVIAAVKDEYPEVEGVKEVALKVDGVWERMRTYPPGPLATLLLLALYAGALLLSLAGLVVFFVLRASAAS